MTQCFYFLKIFRWFFPDIFWKVMNIGYGTNIQGLFGEACRGVSDPGVGAKGLSYYKVGPQNQF